MSEIEKTVTEIVLLIAGGIAIAMFLKRAAANEAAFTQKTETAKATPAVPYYLTHNLPPSQSYIVPSPSGGNSNANVNPVVQHGSAVGSFNALLRQSGAALTAIAANIVRGTPKGPIYVG